MCRFRLQSGTSRTHFEMWCEDRRNGVIIADFAVQGTLAREVLGSPSEVMTRAGVKVGLCGRPRRPSGPRDWAHSLLLCLFPCLP